MTAKTSRKSCRLLVVLSTFTPRVTWTHRMRPKAKARTSIRTINPKLGLVKSIKVEWRWGQCILAQQMTWRMKWTTPESTMKTNKCHLSSTAKMLKAVKKSRSRWCSSCLPKNHPRLWKGTKIERLANPHLSVSVSRMDSPQSHSEKKLTKAWNLLKSSKQVQNVTAIKLSACLTRITYSSPQRKNGREKNSWLKMCLFR